MPLSLSSVTSIPPALRSNPPDLWEVFQALDPTLIPAGRGPDPLLGGVDDLRSAPLRGIVCDPALLLAVQQLFSGRPGVALCASTAL